MRGSRSREARNETKKGGGEGRKVERREGEGRTALDVQVSLPPFLPPSLPSSLPPPHLQALYPAVKVGLEEEGSRESLLPCPVDHPVRGRAIDAVGPPLQHVSEIHDERVLPIE
eukprot:709256-Hanusia_phi.AAC.1